MSTRDFPLACRVMSMEEVLRIIFNFLDVNANAVNARVCKTWSDEALSVVWRDVKASTIFALLAPLEENMDRLLGFSRHIVQDDWIQFDRYSGRVRCLSIDIRDAQVNPSVWREMSYGRPRMDILPRLEVVQASFGSLMTSLFFCHPSVTCFEIKEIKAMWEEIVPESFDSVLSYLPAKMPRLTTFRCPNATLMSPDTQTLFESMLERLTSIHTLSVSSQWLTPKAMDVLSSVRLQEIRILSFPEGRSSAASANITLQGKELIRRLGISQPRLEFLSLDASRRQPRINFDVIKPILSLSRLSHLILDGLYPSNLNTQHLVTIFQSLPALLSFTMKFFPTMRTKPSLRLSSLAAIIPFCNNLEHLTINVDAASESLLIDSHGPCFPKLKSLRLPYSHISRPISVARFLSGILPQGCALDYQGHEGWEAAMRVKEWETVKKLLPEFWLARSSERDKLNQARLREPRSSQCSCRGTLAPNVASIDE